MTSPRFFDLSDSELLALAEQYEDEASRALRLSLDAQSELRTRGFSPKTTWKANARITHHMGDDDD